MRDLGLTFAGGGNRCFYQQGLLEHWSPRLWPRVAAVAGVSAGAAMAVLLLSDRLGEARVHWDQMRQGVTKNIDLSQALRGRRVTPHTPIYRSMMMRAMENGGLERLRAQPFPVYVLCSIPPRRLPVFLATWLGLSAYALEKRFNPKLVHTASGSQLGFREYFFDARRCETPAEVADLVIASSATPPFTPVGSFRLTRTLDGGLVDNAPAFLLEREAGVRRNLVLLTRHYEQDVTGVSGPRLYIAPSEPVPVHRWDYTPGARVDEAIDLGRRDALQRNPLLESWLGMPAVAHAEVSARA